LNEFLFLFLFFILSVFLFLYADFRANWVTRPTVRPSCRGLLVLHRNNNAPLAPASLVRCRPVVVRVPRGSRYRHHHYYYYYYYYYHHRRRRRRHRTGTPNGHRGHVYFNNNAGYGQGETAASVWSPIIFVVWPPACAEIATPRRRTFNRGPLPPARLSVKFLHAHGRIRVGGPLPPVTRALVLYINA